MHLWERLAGGDTVLFYATSPVGRVIGYGRMLSEFKQDKPLWPEERVEGRVIWPLRFQFDVSFRLRREEWEKGLSHPELRSRVRSGFQALGDALGAELTAEMGRLYGKGPAIVGSAVRERPEEYKPSLHEELQEKLLSIGGLQTWIAEKEYPMDGRRLDVTWRRVERGAPTYVFEVQVGGNLVEALGKLKHAYDLWNSNLFLVAKKEDVEKVYQHLEGTFHEIRGRLEVLTPEEVAELRRRKEELRRLEPENMVAL